MTKARGLERLILVLGLVAIDCLPSLGDLIPATEPTLRPSLNRDLVVPAIARRDDYVDSNGFVFNDLAYRSRSSAYPSVGSILSGGAFGSGVLITPDAVLTAAHVLAASAASTTFTLNGETRRGRIRILSPTWTGFLPSILKGDDIAVLILDAPLTSVEPARLATGADERGAVGTNVGYGFSGTGSTGQQGAVGTRRAGDNVIDLFGADFFSDVSEKTLLQDFDRPDGGTSTFGSTLPLPFEALITQGDSGGGVFADLGDGPRLLGVHSFLVDWNENGRFADYQDLAGSTLVSRHLDFIQFAVNVPEPSSVVALLLGGLGIGLGEALRRRRTTRVFESNRRVRDFNRA